MSKLNVQELNDFAETLEGADQQEFLNAIDKASSLDGKTCWKSEFLVHLNGSRRLFTAFLQQKSMPPMMILASGDEWGTEVAAA